MYPPRILNEDDFRCVNTGPIHLFRGTEQGGNIDDDKERSQPMIRERTGGSHSIGSRFICRINVEKVFLMADNSGPIVISETYCRWTSYIIPEASTQPTKRIHYLPPLLSSPLCSVCSAHVKTLLVSPAAYRPRERVPFVLSSRGDLYFSSLSRPARIRSHARVPSSVRPRSTLLPTYSSSRLFCPPLPLPWNVLSFSRSLSSPFTPRPTTSLDPLHRDYHRALTCSSL